MEIGIGFEEKLLSWERGHFYIYTLDKECADKKSRDAFNSLIFFIIACNLDIQRS